jgi:phosphohistidine phosphatase
VKLYLQRHAEAQAGEPMDPTRAVTEQGREQVKLMGEFLVRQIGRVDLVVSSNFKRAFDTARGMADLLGCEIVETSPALDPDGKPAIAWSDVEILTGAYCPETADAHVLVVSHHPLVNELAEYLCGVKTSDEKFHHAAVMHIHGNGPGSVMEYFVPPKVVERDEATVIEAAAAVLDSFTEADEPEPTGLLHPKHADVLTPLRAKAQRVMRSYFRRQKRLVLASIKPKLRELRESRIAGIAGTREADDPAKDATKAAIPDLLPISMTGGMSLDYTKALTAALEGGYEGLAGEVGSDAVMAEDVVQTYLADHSLTKLTGGLDETTVERLRTALADTYQAGGDYDALVKAVQSEYAGFNDVRAGLIAQTEMNAAYNAGRKQLGLDMGFNEKAWNPDGTACAEICVPNVLDGWIGMDDDFESGDDQPPGHPNCDCSLDVRYNPRADAVSST